MKIKIHWIKYGEYQIWKTCSVPACCAEQEGKNAPNHNLEATGNRRAINQLERVIWEMREVLQEQDERNRQM